MKARLASPNIVALTPDAVASSAATPITTKPTRPRMLLARLGQHVALVGIHRGQAQRHHHDRADQDVDDDDDAQRQ